jgi:hypothetical protein
MPSIFRHVVVQEDRVVAPLLRQPHRPRAVAAQGDLVPHPQQQLLHVLLVDRVVLGDQQVQRHGRAREQALAFGLCLGCTGLHRGRQPGSLSSTEKVEPLPGVLMTCTSPFIMRARLREISSPRPVPPHPAFARGVGLKETAEQLLHGLRVHAHPGIGHRDDQRLRVVLRAPNAHRDLALVGELDGVAEQVEQNLPHPRLVAVHPVRHVGQDARVHAHAAPRRLRLHQAFDVVDDLADLERLQGQAEGARIHRRHVQDVVEHPQQVLGRALGGIQLATLLLVQRPFADQLQHAKQALEGRAQLVAHVGEKIVVGLVGGLLLNEAGLHVLQLAAQAVGQMSPRAHAHRAPHHQADAERQHQGRE